MSVVLFNVGHRPPLQSRYVSPRGGCFVLTVVAGVPPADLPTAAGTAASTAVLLQSRSSRSKQQITGPLIRQRADTLLKRFGLIA
jgi:hypothetical protein